MSEKLSSNNETKANNAWSHHLEKGDVKFNPEKATRLIEQHKQKMKESEVREDKSKDLTLQASSEKKEQQGELSPQDAAEEYLSLLDELSRDFTNPFYSEKRQGRQHTAGGLSRDLGKKYSKNPHYRWHGYLGTEAGDMDGTMIRMGSAEALLESEMNWREGSSPEMRMIDRNMDNLKDEYSKKGKLGKFFGKRKYEKKMKQLEQAKELQKEVFIRNCNRNIARELAISYNERGDYDYNGGDYGKSQNEARNRQFFGLDDPERAAKVERAIELRKKYQTKWAKDKAA